MYVCMHCASSVLNLGNDPFLCACGLSVHADVGYEVSKPFIKSPEQVNLNYLNKINIIKIMGGSV